MAEKHEVMDEILKLDASGSANTAPKPTQEQARQNLRSMSDALAHIEAQQLSGAPSLTPKEVMLDISDLKAQHPDKYFRWVNIKSPGNADVRRVNGFIRVPESEGGRQLGDELALFVCTAANRDRQLANFKRLNESRLQAHKADVEQLAEGIAKELRDKHGIKINAERLLITE
ncbi:MAG TPA: hypothetical protein VIY48_21860 [Candidatus Paceibacterota bacterium]|jgi:hypothetical protein